MTSLQPSPISWAPSEYWDGDDGSWSSWALRVGTPGQVVRVLISTAGQATWVVVPQGCSAGAAPACNQARGGLFNYTQSKTWDSKGYYALGLELNFGYNESGYYGLDALALGFSDGSGEASLDSQIVAGIATDDYYVGLFGLGQQPTNLSTFDNSHVSFLTTMRAKGMIPSLSWSYTAGAPYRLKGVFGSLTFGGYDLSRFVRNEVSFNLGPDSSRDLLVGLRTIFFTTAIGSTTSLLPSPILTFIDSTIPYIYLPLEACQEFEKALGLILDPTTGLYLVDDDLHQNLTAMNLSFTFQIGDLESGGPSVDIVLPYASFDLVANFPFVPNTTRYFPLQQAANDSQHTLGRTFLQEAYLITNYEHSNFSVSQCQFEEGLEENIVPILSDITASLPFPTPSKSITNATIAPSTPPTNITSASPQNSTNRGLLLGTSVGIPLSLILSLFIFAFIGWKRRSGYKSQSEPGMVLEIDSSRFSDYVELPENGKVELEANVSPIRSHETTSELSSSNHLSVYELMANWKAASIFQTKSSHANRRLAVRLSTKNVPTGRTRQNSIWPSYQNSHDERPSTASHSNKVLDVHRPLPPIPSSGSARASQLSDILDMYADQEKPATKSLDHHPVPTSSKQNLEGGFF